MKSTNFIKNKGFLVIGHRGVPSLKTENTIESFRTAIDLGITAVEFDVQFSKDSVPVIFHDYDLKRMANLDARVDSLEYSWLKEIKLIGGGSIPELEDIVPLLDSLKAFLEIKVEDDKNSGYLSKITESISEFLKRNNLYDRIAVISFSKIALDLMIKKDANVTTGLDFQEEKDWDYSEMFDAMLPYYKLVPGSNMKTRPVFPWTVDDARIATELKNSGCSGIISNFPQRMLKILE